MVGNMGWVGFVVGCELCEFLVGGVGGYVVNVVVFVFVFEEEVVCCLVLRVVVVGIWVVEFVVGRVE